VAFCAFDVREKIKNKNVEILKAEDILIGIFFFSDLSLEGLKFFIRYFV